MVYSHSPIHVFLALGGGELRAQPWPTTGTKFIGQGCQTYGMRHSLLSQLFLFHSPDQRLSLYCVCVVFFLLFIYNMLHYMF